jgi:cytochrome c556
LPVRPNRLVPVLAAACACSAAVAAVKPETAIRYRQGVYTVIGWNFAPLAQMVRGKTAWDQAEFARRAERIAFLAPQLLEGFPAGSDTGAKTAAKAGIWSHMDDFRAKMDDLVTQSRRLAEVARGGDEAQMKEQFRQTAGACKACHDQYRDEE